MATLVDRHEVEPGVFYELWEEDAKLYSQYSDTQRGARMEMRKRARSANPAIRPDAEGLYGVGYLAPHERHELESKFPALNHNDPATRSRAWKRFWESSHSTPYRTVEKV